MVNLEAKIASIKDTLQASYVKPNPNLVDKYREHLSNSPTALDYLHIGRGFNSETLDNFKIGYDPVRNAITIPVYKRGELINIRYRHLDPNATAKYTQEKGCEVWIYNEDGIEKGKAKGGVLVTEGEFDCMSAWQAGFKNVISPASGKDSYGVWLELLDTIPKVYIAYDNDKPGKSAGRDLADRVGTDKTFEVVYPEGIKDANDYFKGNDAEAFKVLIRNARAYYKYKYQGVKDVIDSIREKTENILQSKFLPFLEIEEDWLIVYSGMSNVGKTSGSLNVVNELVSKEIPCLVLPIERGIRTVGKRFLQVRYNKTQAELSSFDDSDWEKLIPDVLELPLFFSMPNPDQVIETVVKAKRLFNTKVVVIDHLDLLVRKSDAKNINTETSTVIQKFKQVAQEHGIIFIVIHHIKKQDGLGAVPKKPRIEDLKGSSSVYQDPEAVVMLSEPEKGYIEVSILKNKGAMGSKVFNFNVATGKIGEEVTFSSSINAVIPLPPKKELTELEKSKIQAKLDYDNF